jgi:RNA polymerase sigma-70 factor (ECF subfamily)
MVTVERQRESDSDSETLLVRAAKEGDVAAFEELVTRHTALAFRVAMHIMISREDAEEVVQDTFLKAFSHLQCFEERARFSTWITRIAVNTALMKIRSLRRVQTISLDQDTKEGILFIDTVADWKPNPDQLYSQGELRNILQRALDLLPHGNRVVFLLRDVEGMSTEETAEMLGLSTSNVKARLLRARLKLREHLNPCFARETRSETRDTRSRGPAELQAPATAP